MWNWQIVGIAAQAKLQKLRPDRASDLRPPAQAQSLPRSPPKRA
jgi:hypothetical protein